MSDGANNLIEGLKLALSATPRQALSVFVGCCVLLVVTINYIPEKYEYINTMSVAAVIPAAVFYFIATLKGLPDWLDKVQATKERRKLIEGLGVDAKDFLRGRLRANRRTMCTTTIEHELFDHKIVEYVPTIGNKPLPTLSITDEFWPLLKQEGRELLYNGKHRPSQIWPEN